MAKQRRSVPFAQTVDEVTSAPPAPAPFDLHARGGRGYRLIDNDINPQQARDIAIQGAALGWDACGCGGDCGYRWYTAERVAQAATSGAPELRQQQHLKGRIALLRSDEGDHLLLAHFPTRWGDLLD
ncbi:hypothetical protein GTR02_21545 [Kineococcus sp. R8]|uniref:hypothetical protein n=1 Tax=Kineococcus siccus TaxID=2696567 RepID=UPI001411D1C6|nr:hypothetical protein [Kineococcus siccus]NAZ84389.1 hypothetical protein [Kineococcus siccus]